MINQELKRLVTMIRFPSQLGYEKVAMASAATIAARMGFSSERIEDIKTAVAEACINAIEHGNELDMCMPVMVELAENGTGLEINVSDSGQRHIPNHVPCPAEGLQPRGWGMFLIQNLVDEFDFGPTPQGNQVRMRLNLATN
jgi:serine/threonine-protein kinase RsbW